MIVPLILTLASAAALAVSVLLPGYGQLILLAVPCLLAGLILLAHAALRGGPSVAAEPKKRRVKRKSDGPPIVVDGSNVLFWKDNTPQIASVRQVIDHLTAQGFRPGVVFDATIGYKIGTHYLDDAEMAAHLGLPVDRVLVVPSGTTADTVLLATARQMSASIVTNDRYRDWAEAHPEVHSPGLLIRGCFQDGTLWLEPLPGKAPA